MYSVSLAKWNALPEARCYSSDLPQCGVKVPCVHYVSSLHNNAKHVEYFTNFAVVSL